MSANAMQANTKELSLYLYGMTIALARDRSQQRFNIELDKQVFQLRSDTKDKWIKVVNML